jgi:hypothetical protein
MRSKLTAVAAAGMLSLCSTLPAHAGSVTQPGETVGVAAGAPLPPGVYFVNTASYGCRDLSPEDVCSLVTIPVIAWSTPWTILGGRLQFLAFAPALEVGQDSEPAIDSFGLYRSGFYNPGALAQLAWDLGGGWGFSYAVGAYFENDTDVSWSDTSINQRFAISYTGGGWNLTANLIWGIHTDSVNGDPQLSPCPGVSGLNCNPDFINLDLTATKKFGKWEIGPVAFGSWDISDPINSWPQQRQWAVGGLVGYDFGPVTLQVYGTTDVTQDNYNGYETRFWTRIIFPIWNPKLHEPVPVTGTRY